MATPKQATLQALEELKAKYGDRIIPEEELKNALYRGHSGAISFSTLLKYGFIEKASSTDAEKVSVEEVVAELNNEIENREYEYGGSGERYSYEDGEIFRITKTYGYRFK